MNNFYKGKLLLALPLLQDNNFYRSVIFLLEHNEDGAFGFILNRPSKTDIGEVLPQWAYYVKDPQVGFEGGPVSIEVPLGLVETKQYFNHPHWSPVKDNIGILNLESYPELGLDIANMRIFFGHSSWGPRQLENEITLGAWLVLDAQDQDLFSTGPKRLWTTVLKRQEPTIAMLADFPSNPSLN